MKKLTLICAVLCCCTLAFGGIEMKQADAPAVKELKALSDYLLGNHLTVDPLTKEDRPIGAIVDDAAKKAANLYRAGRVSALKARPVGMRTSLAGGEDCSTATVIAALPFSDTGSTAGAVDDYDEICPYDSAGSGDHVYSYTPGADGAINISLCDSIYDTKLYVYEGTCGAYQSGVFHACTDDAGCGITGYQSELVDVAVTGGNTYYIVVDGYGGDTGDYVIDVTEYEDCVVDCIGLDEGEACGDDTNGGCNMVTPAFTAINVGETFCGNAWADSSIRDTDWYEVVLDATTDLGWIVEAEFDVVAGLATTIPPGSGDCADLSGLDPYDMDVACVELSAQTTLDAGTYWFFIAPSVFDSYPCAGGPWEYRATLMECTDVDADGVTNCDGDCDDDDAATYPGATEICDGIDNDCNGATADGADEAWLGAACDGADSDLCEEGVYECDAGAQACTDDTGDDLDVCNGLDDDCNGATADGADEAWLGAACDGADSDLCEEGVYECDAGAQACTDDTGDDLDVCNGLDDDCNGATADGADEAWLSDPCDGPDSDFCDEGVFLCTAGVQTCSDNTGDTLEAFLAFNCDDGFDNDCDGLVDADPECYGDCGCAAFGVSAASRPAQIATSGLIYLFPLGFVLIRLRRFRK